MGEVKVNVVPTNSKNKKINLSSINVKNQVNVEENPTHYYSTLAKQWAVLMDGKVQDEDYSAKYWANQSKLSSEVSETSAENAKKYNDMLDANFNTYINEINTVKDDAITELETSQADTLSNIETAENNALTDIENKKNEALQDISDTADLSNYYDKSEINSFLSEKQDQFVPLLPLNFSSENNEINQLKLNIGKGLSVENGELTVDTSGGGGLEVCDIGMSLYVDETKGLRRYLNGQIVIINTNTQGFLTRLQQITTLYPSLLTTEENWQAAKTLSPFGQVGKFVFNYATDGTTVESVRLPRVVNVQGVFDLQNLGLTVEAGLPNATGSFLPSSPNNAEACKFGASSHASTSGALYMDDFSNTACSRETDNNYRGGVLKLDLSKSSSIYGNSNTVQQEQIQYPYFIQVATGAETKDEITNEHELVNPYVLLEPKFFETPVYNLSWLISNGSFTGSKAVHPHAYDALLIELNADIEVGTTQNNYTKRGLPVKLATDSYTDYDFVVNPTDETFRPPLKVNLASSKAIVGNGMTLGLTDGSNYAGTGAYSFSGATGLVSNRIVAYGVEVGTEYSNTTSLGTAKAIGVTTDPTKSGLELADSNLYLYFYVGEVAQNTNLVNAGRLAEVKADKTAVDGQWIQVSNTPVILSTRTAIGKDTIDLSTYLPNDNYSYELLIWSQIEGQTGSGGPIVYCNSEILTIDTQILWGAITKGQGIGVSAIIPVGSNHNLSIGIGLQAAIHHTTQLYAYRRIGTNT